MHEKLERIDLTTEDLQEAELIERLIQRDEAAYRLAVKTYHSGMVYLAR